MTQSAPPALSLEGNSDDQPDWPTGPMCADCYQAREMDNEIWAAELQDEAES